MKKRILFVIDSLNSGGAEKSLVSLLSLFDYENYEIDLLTFKEGGLYVPLLSENVRLIDPPDIFSKMKLSILDLIKIRKKNLANKKKTLDKKDKKYEAVVLREKEIKSLEKHINIKQRLRRLSMVHN